MNNLERFTEVYSRHYDECCRTLANYPPPIQNPREREEKISKYISYLKSGWLSLEGAVAVRKTCEELSIPFTHNDIKTYLRLTLDAWLEKHGEAQRTLWIKEYAESDTTKEFDFCSVDIDMECVSHAVGICEDRFGLHDDLFTLYDLDVMQVLLDTILERMRIRP